LIRPDTAFKSIGILKPGVNTIPSPPPAAGDGLWADDALEERGARRNLDLTDRCGLIAPRWKMARYGLPRNSAILAWLMSEEGVALMPAASVCELIG
jgi:hypothetical protein